MKNFFENVLNALSLVIILAYPFIIIPNLLKQYLGFSNAFIFSVLITIIGTIIVSKLTKKFYIIGPSIAITTFFVYQLTDKFNDWKIGIAAAFISGVVLFIISYTKIRKWFYESFPKEIKKGIRLGVAFFLIKIALENIRFGFEALPFIVVILTGIYLIEKREKNLFIAIFLGFITYILIAPLIPSTYVEFANIKYVFPINLEGLVSSNNLSLILSLFLVLFFETYGNMVAIGKIKNEIMVSDSITTILGSFFGIPGTTIYPETVLGHHSNVKLEYFVGILILSILIFPIAMLVPFSIVMGALLLSGIIIIKNTKIDKNLHTWIIALLVPLTSSLTIGIGSGLIIYTILSLIERKKVPIGLIIISILFLLDFIGIF